MSKVINTMVKADRHAVTVWWKAKHVWKPVRKAYGFNQTNELVNVLDAGCNAGCPSPRMQETDARQPLSNCSGVALALLTGDEQ